MLALMEVAFAFSYMTYSASASVYFQRSTFQAKLRHSAFAFDVSPLDVCRPIGDLTVLFVSEVRQNFGLHLFDLNAFIVIGSCQGK